MRGFDRATPAPKDSIDDTLDWLEARMEACRRAAVKTTGNDRMAQIDEAARFGHAFSLIAREYKPHRRRA